MEKPTMDLVQVCITYYNDANGIYSSIEYNYDISRLIKSTDKNLGSRFTHYREMSLLNQASYSPRNPTEVLNF
jgi:hypothetical protein